MLFLMPVLMSMHLIHVTRILRLITIILRCSKLQVNELKLRAKKCMFRVSKDYQL